MLNQMVICGRLTRDPELRRTGSGLAVTSFTVAVDRDIPEKDGNRAADFVDCVAWREKGEFVSKYFSKGSMIVVAGRMQSRDWTDKAGNKRRNWELQAANVYFGSSKEASSQRAGTAEYGDYGGQPPQGGNAYGGSYGPYAGAGGYAAPQNPGGDFAMLTDDDGQLPF